MKHNYDTVAAFYDRFSRLVFGTAQVDAQLCLLPFLPHDGRVLIVGGGTGWILEEIAKVRASGLHISYVDASRKMVERAEKRNAGVNKVTFIASPLEDVFFDAPFDVVLTPFLFDNFTDDGATKLFSVIDAQMKPGGVWLYCDFRDTGSWLHRLTLKAMYLFFGLCCGVPAGHLPDMESHFAGYHYQCIAESIFTNGFIVSCAYKKDTH